VASRRAPATAVVLLSQLLSCLLAVALALVRGETFPGPSDVALAAGAGVATAVALAAFYRGLATARVGVVAPVAAVLGAAIPVVVSIAISGLPAPVQLAGMAVGLIGVGLVSRAPDEGDRPLGIGIALLAGVGFGAFFVCLGSLEGDAVFWPLVVARIVAGASMFVAARVGGRPPLPPRSLLPLVALVSVLDMIGMAGYLFAAQIGRLDEAAVLSSLYPVVTIVLAAAVFRERIGGLQALGIGLAMLAIALIGGG
jgi:drug/metabolite transporter (DMT)-like permease